MEHYKYTKMGKTARLAGLKQGVKTGTFLLSTVLEVILIVLGVLIILQAPVMHINYDNTTPTVYAINLGTQSVNFSYKIPANFFNKTISLLAKNTTSLASIVVYSWFLGTSLIDIFVGIGTILLAAWIERLFTYTDSEILEIQEARRNGLLKAGFTEADINEFRKERERLEKYL